MLALVLSTVKAKLYPNATQARALTAYLDQARQVFNSCLADRRDAWRESQTKRSRFDQTKMLTRGRAANEELRRLPVQIGRDAIRRVDLAFQGFFRRVKAKTKRPGYPRFKGVNRYNSFTIGECGDVLKIQGRVRVSGIDKPLRARGLRPFVGTIKRLCIVRRAGKWFARILVDDGQAAPAKRPITTAIGIDMGLNSFLTTSEGQQVKCPKHYRRLEGTLRRAGRHVSRCKRGSGGRQRAVQRLQAVHAKIADCRNDFTHKLSKSLVAGYSLIAAEKLNIGGMVKSRLAKSILDAAWGQFLWQTGYKAEKAGVRFVQVNPRHTSQECSRCGQLVPKDLSVRVHRCTHCGLVLDRDVNAAKVILKRGLVACASESTPASGSDVVMRAEGRKPPAVADAALLTPAGS